MATYDPAVRNCDNSATLTQTAYDYLMEEAQMTPAELYNDIVESIRSLSRIQNKRNRQHTSEVFHTLVTCADFVKAMLSAR